MSGSGYKSIKDGGPKAIGAAFPTRTPQEQFQNRCRHFKGMHTHDSCEAGVRYADVAERPNPGPVRLPCFADQGISERCPSCSFPTAAEAQAHEAGVRRSIANIGTARKAITEATAGARGVRGDLPCPICGGGTLHYSISGYNGHCHARCTTEGCVSWME